ncbi:MAG: ferredoxin family protein [Candidatus Bathyarchaeia archaeon]
MPEVIVDYNVCEGAGVCVEVCPVNVYDMVEIDGEEKAKPARSDECILCLSCVNSCPTGSITVEE